MAPFDPRPLTKHYFPWLLIALSAPAWAESPAKRQFDTLTVTATRQEERVGDVAGSVDVIDEQQIDRQNINTIQDLVRYQPGISVGGTGSRFGSEGVSIRGIGGNRVLTQVDGLSVPDAFAFGPFLSAQRDYVDMDIIKRVEIIRGPASSLYGSDAIGGAVSFLTRDAGDYLHTSDDQYARFKLGYDSADNSWLRSTTLAGRRGEWDAMLHLGRRSGHEMETYGGKGGSGSSREQANPVDFTTDNLMAKLGWDYSDSGRLQLTYEHFKDDADTRLLSDYSNTATTRTSQADDQITRDRFSLQHLMQLDSLLVDRLSWQLSYQDSENRQQTLQDRVSGGTAVYRTRDSRYSEKLWALNAQLEKDLIWGSSDHKLIYGIDAKRLRNDDLRLGQQRDISSGTVTAEPPSSDFPDPTTLELAAFVQDRIRIGSWTITPGLRYDHYRMKPDVTQQYLNTNPADDDPASYSDSALSPKLSISYAINPEHSVYAQYAAGFRAPQAIEIFGEFENPGMYRTLANQDLEAETSDSYELGLRGNYSAGSFGLAAFYNRYDNFIEQVSRPSAAPGFPFGEFQYVNLDKVTIYGAEAEGELYLDTLGLPLGSRLRGSLAYAHGTDEESDQPINSIDPLKGVMGLGYDEPASRYGGELIWTLVADKSRIDETETANQYQPAGYGLLDLTAYWQITEGVQLNGGVYNLTDKQYWNWTDVRGLPSTQAGVARYSQPGRNASVNIVWEI